MLGTMRDATATAPVVIAPAGLEVLIEVLVERGHRVIGPTVRDGAIVLDDVHGLADLPAGWGDEQEAGRYRLHRRNDGALFGYAVSPQSPRQFLSPPRVRLWSATRTDDGFEVDEPPADPVPPLAFLGVRACELAAIGVQDRVFRDATFPDPAYVSARDRAFFVAVNCGTAARTCFCTSMGTGPAAEDGHDLALTELLGPGRHDLLVEVGTDAGADVLSQVVDRTDARPASDDDLTDRHAVLDGTKGQMVRSLDPLAARDVLAANLEHPRWDDVAERCLSCANCTLVCPTCFCSAVEDVTTLDGAGAERVRRWDSCFTMDHSYLHGTGSVRGDTRARYRQWLTHKLSTWWDQYDTSGCVGCGRCIAWCPAAIDLTEEVAAISAGPGATT